MKLLLRLALLAALLLPAVPAAAQAGARTLVVAPDGAYASLAAALAAAEAGDTIEVHGGVHPGPLLVDKPVSLVGMEWPVIDGQGQGTVVKLTAPGITLRGFVIRASGASLDEENSGIAGEAPDLLIENNKLEDTLFGIYLREASGSILRGNTIQSKDLDVPRRGDPIRVWYSDRVLIEGNNIARGRDVVLWYSAHLTVRDNQVRAGRYGLHFMYCDDATIERNLLAGNSVGAFLMYSRRMTLRDNTIANNRGPSGFGVGLKDMDDAVVAHNLFYDNRVGAHLDNSPREIDSLGLFENNVFGYNDIGVNLMPSVRHNQFSGNSFIDNNEQVSIAGGGQLRENSWTVAGRGNYWSDYVGYDEGSDGLGDEPYRADRLFENLVDRFPSLGLFAFSPSVQAIDFAAKAVPLVRPQPKLSDMDPLMAPILPPRVPPLQPPPAGPLILACAALLGFGALSLAFFRRVRPGSPQPGSMAASSSREKTMISTNQLTKRFGEVLAVDGVTVQIQAGESVALWGPNGAGKTTILHCALGLLDFEGQLETAGRDVRTQGKAVRAAVGFVPQELNFHHDLRVDETMVFYARLKKASSESAQQLLEKLGLAAHAGKRVGELSGGMKQRLALALSLLADPQLLVLDEPTANLDVESRRDLLRLLAAIKAEGKTLLFSSHRLDEVHDLADRVLVLRQGRLTADCSPDQIFEQAGTHARLSLSLDREQVAAAIQALQGQGYAVHPNGKRIWVKVAAHEKGEPINALAQAGIAVRDFHVDLLEEGEADES